MPSYKTTSKVRPVSQPQIKNNNEKSAASKQYKALSRFPDVNSPVTAAGSNTGYNKSRDPIKLPKVDSKSGNNQYLSKVNFCLDDYLQ